MSEETVDEPDFTFDEQSSLTDEPVIDRVFCAVTGWLKVTFILGGVAMALAALSAPVLGRLRSAEMFAILGFYSQVCVLAWGLLGILRTFARTFAGALLVAFLVAVPVSAMTFWVVERLHATAGEGLGWGGILRAGAQLAALVTLPLGFLIWRDRQATRGGEAELSPEESSHAGQ